VNVSHRPLPKPGAAGESHGFQDRQSPCVSLRPRRGLRSVVVRLRPAAAGPRLGAHYQHILSGACADRFFQALASGLFRIAQHLCINTRLLKNLVHRCKPSINNAPQQLGYSLVEVRSTTDRATLRVHFLPRMIPIEPAKARNPSRNRRTLSESAPQARTNVTVWFQSSDLFGKMAQRLDGTAVRVNSVCFQNWGLCAFSFREQMRSATRALPGRRLADSERRGQKTVVRRTFRVAETFDLERSECEDKTSNNRYSCESISRKSASVM
jgi:hypothetical protein